MGIEECEFISVTAAARALAEDLASVLREAIAVRGRALLAVSGGNTPRYVFEHLCQLVIDWSKVSVTLTDDRWVPQGNPDSNEKLIRGSLLKGPAKAASFIPLYSADCIPSAGQINCETRLQSLELPFDAVYLGMGADGHFASLFPNEHAIEVRDSLCVYVPGTAKRLPRISLTVSAILNSRKIYLLYGGKEKHETFNKAKQEHSCRENPLQIILSQDEVPVSVMSAP